MSQDEKQQQVFKDVEENHVPLLNNFEFVQNEELSFQYVQENYDGPSIDIKIPKVNSSNAVIKIKDNAEELQERKKKFSMLLLEDINTLFYNQTQSIKCPLAFTVAVVVINTALLLISIFLKK